MRSSPPSLLQIVSVCSVITLALFGAALNVVRWEKGHLRMGTRRQHKVAQAVDLLF